MHEIIRVQELTKHYRVPTARPPASRWQQARRFFVREWEPVMAVQEVSFSVARGEAVALLGPNGAGKTTTIKMLTGILTPTSGEAVVAGYVPHRQRYEYTYHIGLVMGQKSLLLWDIPVIESLRLYQDIYDLDPAAFRRRMAEFSEMLELDQLLHIPVRKLSLGQRMRAEIAASLLHQPEVIFLDEPTIGLDLVSKRKVIEFIKTVNHTEGVTIMLTTHNIPDVEQLCRRVLLIDKGRLVYDGSIQTLQAKCQYQIVEFATKQPLAPVQLEELATGLPSETLAGDNRYAIRVPQGRIGEITQRVNQGVTVDHLAVRLADLEDVLGDIYEGRICP